MGIAVCFVFSCATFRPAEPSDGAQKVLELINSENIETLIEHSRVPFLLDGEIVALKTDVAMIWKALAVDGVGDVRGTSEMIADSFGTTMDVRVFLSSLPEDAYFVRLDTSNGQLLLILGKLRWGIPEIYGLKGFGP